MNLEMNRIHTGDCTEVLKTIPSESVDLVLTDPPYLACYRPRDGRTIRNDTSDAWLRPAFKEAFRVLRRDAICVSFYGWPAADIFLAAFKEAGFRPVSHLCFTKGYPSFKGYTHAHHEVAYVLAKGEPGKPQTPPPDVLAWRYTGNKIHPTQKPVSVLTPLVNAFSSPGGLVLDPFCGSGSSLIAARNCGRNFIGIELDSAYAQAARMRLSEGGGARAA